MALTTLYFDTGAFGAGDGSNWANRASLLSGSTQTPVWSPYITNFNFTGTSLRCMVASGTYSGTMGIQASVFTGAPSANNPIFFHGCDSTGAPLAPTNYGWTSDVSPYSDSAFPQFISTGIQICNLSAAYFAFCKLVLTGNAGGNSYTTATNCTLLWCSVQNGMSGNGANGVNSTPLINCSLTATSQYYAYLATTVDSYNSRFRGNPTAFNGSRAGMMFQNGHFIDYSTFADLFAGIKGNASALIQVNNSQFAGISGNCIDVSTTTNPLYVTNTEFTNSTGAAVASNGRAFVFNARAFRNSSNLSGLSNYPDNLLTYTGAGTNAEYVNYDSGDFRSVTSAQNSALLYGVSRVIQSTTSSAA